MLFQNHQLMTENIHLDLLLKMELLHIDGKLTLKFHLSKTHLVLDTLMQNLLHYTLWIFPIQNIKMQLFLMAQFLMQVTEILTLLGMKISKEEKDK